MMNSVVVLPAPSRPTTVIVFAPPASETLRLQFAVPVPDAVPPVADAPLTVTLVMPLPPVALSLAVPDTVMLEVVTVCPDVGLVIVTAGAAESRLIVICDWRALPLPSVAMTVTTFALAARATLVLQFEVLLPVAVPPAAAIPFTVTLAMPLPPAPLSVAVPASVILAVLTIWLFVWLVIDNVGAVVSGIDTLSVIVDVLAFPAPSVAITVNRFAPETSVSARLQFAVLLPVAVPPVAATPLTVTFAIPLPPAPLSVAVPESVTFAEVTV